MERNRVNKSYERNQQSILIASINTVADKRAALMIVVTCNVGFKSIRHSITLNTSHANRLPTSQPDPLAVWSTSDCRKRYLAFETSGLYKQFSLDN